MKLSKKWRTKMTLKKKCNNLIEVNNLIQRLYYEGACTYWKVYEALPYFIVEYDVEIEIEDKEEE